MIYGHVYAATSENTLYLVCDVYAIYKYIKRFSTDTM